MLRIRDKNVLFSGKKVSLISFTIAGTSYQAEEGMTWVEWLNSDYNTDGYYYILQGVDSYICINVNTKKYRVMDTNNTSFVHGGDHIVDGGRYSWELYIDKPLIISCYTSDGDENRDAAFLTRYDVITGVSDGIFQKELEEEIEYAFTEPPSPPTIYPIFYFYIGDDLYNKDRYLPMNVCFDYKTGLPSSDIRCFIDGKWERVDSIINDDGYIECKELINGPVAIKVAPV